MPKPFHHGTVRSWKRGTVMKHGSAWNKLGRDRTSPSQPVPSAELSTLGGNTYLEAPKTSDTLAAIAQKMGVGESVELAEKIAVPSTPKGKEAYAKSLNGWAASASKVALSYKDKLDAAKDTQSMNMAATIGKLESLLQSISDSLAQAAELSGKIK